MFCRYCGNQLPDSASFCTSCGAAVVKDQPVTINPELSYSYQPENAVQNEMPMKWYKFLIYFLIWVGAVYNVLYGIIMIRGTHYGADADMIYSMFEGLKAVDVVFGVLMIAFAVYMIYVRFQLAGYRKNAPALLLIGYGASLAISVIYLAAVFITLSGYGVGLLDLVDASFIVSIVSTGIIVVLTKVYFDKRRHLFVN